MKSASPAERRQAKLLLPEFGAYTPGILRVEVKTAESLKAHDETWGTSDSNVWQSDYSLGHHSRKLSKVMGDIGTTRGRSDRQIMLGRVAGLLHDVGKLDEACRIYRVKRELTPEERAEIDKHAGISGDYVLKQMSDVRPEDRIFLADVHPIVRYHHAPWLIRDPELRELGFDLKIADIFVSMMEHRHRPGLSQFQAVEALEEVVLRMMKDATLGKFSLEIQASMQTIMNKYGVDRNVIIIK
ncbi:MAG: metal dependent phosphohydrolase [Parcubacteria group bacterium]|nr:metal dependent phosphohydrolase [Parcubacteria group bacterium]